MAQLYDIINLSVMVYGVAPIISDKISIPKNNGTKTTPPVITKRILSIIKSNLFVNCQMESLGYNDNFPQ